MPDLLFLKKTSKFKLSSATLYGLNGWIRNIHSCIFIAPAYSRGCGIGVRISVRHYVRPSNSVTINVSVPMKVRIMKPCIATVLDLLSKHTS